MKTPLTSVAVLLFATGCAFANVHVHPPASPLQLGVKGGNGRVIALDAPFEDDRLSRARCGMQKNGYNMDTASVFCDVEPSIFLADTFAEALQAAGFQVVHADAHGPEALVLHGELLQYFVEPDLGFWTFSPEADLSVHLIATSASGLTADRTFYVKGVETSLFGFEPNFQSASDSATRKLVGEMVTAVIGLMDRYPTLGRANQPIALSLR